ncbi:hypothetical protein FISHEDRAFT_55189 [Fistulina hepatica ATCC 64428]|uniref:MACPF domain-containing protein n=1 Tax=Fistulina hepatica ATCC 64428 TaxID=1128425 RepID=A0A0D7ANL9_9AGAR|nr:hypothetical protein FISHEDRAFT_55189 [Fistulina hepatica ATCC 64428]
MTGSAAIPRSPLPSFYLDGMRLSTGIDAITGEVTKSALSNDFKKVSVTHSQESETFACRILDTTQQVEAELAASSSSSVTFPVSAMTAGVNGTFDFPNTSSSTSAVCVIMLDWQRFGMAERILDSSARLSSEACAALRDNPESFRLEYGDYFVHEITHMAKFSAIWKVTSDTLSSITEFKHAISDPIATADVAVFTGFPAKLKRAQEISNVSIELSYQTMPELKSKGGDVFELLQNFRKATTFVPVEVQLLHYSVVDPSVPTDINMDPDLYCRIHEAFSDVRFVLFLIGIAPEFDRNPEAFRDAIEELGRMRAQLLFRLRRQELVTEMHSRTYFDYKRQFAVDHENEHGAWIRSQQNAREFALGRTSYTNEELRTYGIVSKEGECSTSMEVHVDKALFQQQIGALTTSAIDGYIVGIVVVSCRDNGRNGWWCIHPDFALGTKKVQVGVKSERTRGMHWRLRVYYIPSGRYDGDDE